VDYPKSVPSVGLVNGQFVDEDVVSGTPGSLIPSAWGNAVTLELLNVIQASGLNPDEADLTQLLKAVRKIGQLDAGNYTVDTGSANAYICSFTPAITARSDGQVLRFKAKTANTGASTINDGMGVAPLVGGAHAALQGGELVANGDAWIQWNNAVGGGSYILLFCTGGAEQIAPATQSQHAVQLGQIGQATTTQSGMVKIATDTLIAAGTDATTAITPLGLKNKSQASLYDSTPSKLLSTGAYGWGSTYSSGPLYVSDSTGTQVAASGLYRYDTSTNGRPTFGVGFGSLLQTSAIFDGSGNYATQLAIDYASNAIGFRRLTGSSGWQPWQEIFHRGNLAQATTAVPGIVQLGTAADVLAGTSTTLVPSIAALVSGLLGTGGRAASDYIVIPYIDKATGVRKNKIIQWTTTPPLSIAGYWTWNYPVALTVGVQTMGGMMIGSTAGTLEVAAGAGLTSAQFANGTAGSNSNPAFVFIIGE